MYGKNTEKLTALSFSCNENAIEFLSGKKGILKNHRLFGGLDKSEFLRFAFVYTLNNLPTEKQLFELLKFCKNPTVFDSFCKNFKGGF